MLNVSALRNGLILDSMTARELLAKATVVFCEKCRLSPSELSRKYEKRLQTFLQKAWMQFEISSMRWLKNTRDSMKL
jgi:hypothetical protein